MQLQVTMKTVENFPICPAISDKRVRMPASPARSLSNRRRR